MGERHGDADPFLGLSPSLSLDALLAAVRTAPVDPVAEGRAVAAYRAARERGAHGARTRRRDDWTDRADWHDHDPGAGVEPGAK
ncbi:hypothetical protein ACFRDV_19235 [Streptomyces fagopyri]|uniref:hypothetical protein n=1 Tax=Streptomyces fagopyri TaxID=2662397 RepID=UPI0036D16A82